MEKEYYSNTQMGNYPKYVVFLLFSFFPLLGILLACAAVYASFVSIVIDGSPLELGIALFVYTMSVACFFFVLGWALLSTGLAKYRFKSDGLYAKYPARPEIKIPWDEFQQICICFAAYTTRGVPRANTVICCVKNGEKHNGRGRWKTDNPFRYRSVICIDYKPALVEGLKEKCPYTVVDLRNTPAYKLRQM